MRLAAAMMRRFRKEGPVGMATGPLEGKVAIVTGAAMGMGEATARVFAAAGAQVLVSDIDSARGQATVERIERDGGSASFCRTDVSKAADAQAMVRAAVERYGRLDCAVNNAAVTPDTHPMVTCRTHPRRRRHLPVTTGSRLGEAPIRWLVLTQA
jgi:NAD(P)-dependent dehydrogenase (short-subunit alcohol dehydrogenase family)